MRSPKWRAFSRGHSAISSTHSMGRPHSARSRSEEHTSELQSQPNLVCRLLLEKKNYSPLAVKTHKHSTHKLITIMRIRICQTTASAHPLYAIIPETSYTTLMSSRGDLYKSLTV